MRELKIIIWTYTVQIITYKEDRKGKSFVRKLLIIPLWYWIALKTHFHTILSYKWPCLFELVSQKRKDYPCSCNKPGLRTHSKKCTLYWTSAHVSEYLPERCCFEGQGKLKWNICSYKRKHVQCWINTQQQITITLIFGLPHSTKA